jgi:hypothetical protein
MNPNNPMDLHPGDLLRIKSPSVTQHGNKYSQGIVLDLIPDLHSARILWADGIGEEHDLIILRQYYNRIPYESR